MIVNYASSSINKLKASLNDDTRVFIYDRHMFIVQATGEALGLILRRLKRLSTEKHSSLSSL